MYERYMREMHEKLGYFASWMPNEKISLGDVGIVQGMRFERVTSLADLGVDFVKGHPSPAADIVYSSSGQVTVAVNADGASVGVPGASVAIEFSHAGATFFQAVKCISESITNLVQLEAAVKKVRDAGNWSRKYMIVTTLLHTGPTAVLVSNQPGAKIDLSLPSGGDGPNLLLAGMAGSISVRKASGLAANVILPKGATPLFRTMGIRRKLGGRGKLSFRSNGSIEGRGEAEYGADDDALMAISWKEYSSM
jgi:hypothetical protein